MAENEQTLKVLDFTEYPGPRYSNQGPNSGEDFYHEKLNPAFVETFIKNGVLTVILDGTAGFASSFLDQAFGNLIFDFTLTNVKNHLRIVSIDEPDWMELIENEVFPEWEQRRINKIYPKTTKNHSPWKVLQEDKLLEGVWRQPTV